MNPSCLFLSSPFQFPLFFVFFVVLFELPLTLSNPDIYRNCSDHLFKCGKLSAGYPFWGEDRSDYCGHPDLKLECENDDTTILELEGVKYQVLSIDNNNQILKIARQDYSNGICQPKSFNTFIDPRLFDFQPGYKNITFYYGRKLPNISVPGWFNCSSSSFGYANEKSNNPAGMICDYNVTVPVAERVFTGGVIASLSLLGQVLKEGFEVRLKIDSRACDEDCLAFNGTCGFDSFSSTCYCANPPYNGSRACLSPPPSQPPKEAGVSAGLAGIVAISIVVICWLRRTIFFRKKDAKHDHNVEAFISNNGSLAPKRYNHSDVKKMTNSFANTVGKGGFGAVYRGKLPDGRLVAVKVLRDSKSTDGEDFINEVASMSRTSHVNIVTLLGFCYERTKRALIYEFVPNGSLDKFIYDKGTLRTDHNLEWETLYKIAVGIARGLEYLHRGCNTRIVHFDIKPHNILLDEDFCPKISDFGLAKLCQKKESIISMLGARGTAGYIAPEVFCRNFGGVSHKSDVYSYGMMVLEMVGGRKNIDPRVSHTSEIYFPHWIYNQLEPGEDLRLHRDLAEEEEKSARKMVIVGLWCIQTSPSDRPSMTKVVEMLEGSLESLQIPPKPFLSSPKESPKHLSTTSSL